MASITTGLIEKVQIDSNAEQNIASTAYGECTTDASNAAKTVEMTGFSLLPGVTVHIKFIHENTADNPTLNINTTGAKPIVQYGTTAVGKTSETNGWQAGAVLSLTYDGTSWVRDQGYNTNTTYTHPTSAGNKHIPSGGSSGQFLGWSAAGTAKWVDNPDTDTHRPIQLEGVEILGNNTTALNFKAGSNIDITNNNGVLTIAGTYDYTLPIAKYNVLGGLKPAYSSTGAVTLTTTAAQNNETPTIAARTTTANRYYAIEIDKNGIAYVNIPWTDHYAWADIQNKPATATRWPKWEEITDAPETATRWPKWNEIAAGADALTEGNSDITDHTEILTSYATDNGFADTNGKGIVYKRDAIHLYNYIQDKTDALYVTKATGVTNVAWDATNTKLTKTINGSTTDIVTAETLKAAINVTAADLGLSKAMRFIGVATVAITDGSTTDPRISGYSAKTAGDVIIDKDSSREFVWSTTNKWELLGGDESYWVSSTDTAAKFWRGDNTWSDTISGGTIKVTNNSNTVTIGSQNANFTHIYNSASIPFIFNNTILTTSGNLGNTTYPFNNLYIGAKGSRSIYYVGTKATNAMITFLDNTSNTYGNGIKIGGGGVVVIGAGEAATNLSVAANSETLYLTSDEVINIEAGGNTIANRVGMQVTAAGHIIPIKAEAANTNVQNLGASNNTWANVYATTFHGALDGNAATATNAANTQSKYGALSFIVEGDADTYYPVSISGYTGHGEWTLLNISRNYGEQAPSTWNTASHKGGLVLTILSNGDSAWGGNHQIGIKKLNTILDLSQQYCTMVADITVTNFGLVVWLRGGGAKYWITSNGGQSVTVTPHYESYTASSSTVEPTTTINTTRIDSYRWNNLWAINKANAANITTTTNAIAYYTDKTGTFGSKASANGALYATSTNGELQWGILPIAQGGTNKSSWTNFGIVYTDNDGFKQITAGAADNNEQVLISKGAAAPDWYSGLSLAGTAEANYIATFKGTTASTSTTSGALKVAGGLGVAGQVTAERLAANGSDTNYNLYVNGTSYLNGQTNTKNIVHLNGNAVNDGTWTTGATGTAGDGTNAGTLGTSILTIGNATAQTSTNGSGKDNSKGYLHIYGAGTGYGELTYNDSMFASTKSFYLTNNANSGINNEIRGCMASSDLWRVAGGATASNAGYMEIATADDGNEPIYVHQYTGTFVTVKRTATLLDASGNTEFPVQVTAPKFIGALEGNADTATTADKVVNNLIIKLNNGTTEDTNMYTYNGSAGKTLNIIPGSNITFTTAAGSLTIAGTANDAVTQNVIAANTNKEYGILFSAYETNTTTTTATSVYRDSKIYINPSLYQIVAGQLTLHDKGSTAAEKVSLLWNTTDQALEFIFV